MGRFVVAASIGGVILALLSAGRAPAAAQATADGMALYREHCASCHGKEGGGDGPLAVDLAFKPRAFKEGKFSFGNTADAMVKTVLSGVPGAEKARMPAFKNVLEEKEIAAVVDYVRTLMPPQPVLTPTDMKLEVRDTAKVVRGILAPLREGEHPLARGLLVGLPSGFSFEYATENLHLVAVRRGEFVMRSDWEGRGGRPLTPLGTALFTAPELEQWVPFTVAPVATVAAAAAGDENALAPLVAKLRATRVEGAAVALEYDLLDLKEQIWAHVVERPREVVVAGGVGIVQELTVTATNEGATLLRWSLAAGCDPKLALAAESPPRGEGKIGNIVDRTFDHIFVEKETGWHVTRMADGMAACVRIDASAPAHQSTGYAAAHETVHAQVTLTRQPVTLRRAIVFRQEVTFAALNTMTGELE